MRKAYLVAERGLAVRAGVERHHEAEPETLVLSYGRRSVGRLCPVVGAKWPLSTCHRVDVLVEGIGSVARWGRCRVEVSPCYLTDNRNLAQGYRSIHPGRCRTVLA